MGLTPRCYLPADASTGATVTLPTTGWTNAGQGVSGTAPVANDLVAVISGHNVSGKTVSQTAGATYVIKGPDTQATIPQLDTFAAARVWDGTETGATFTWSSGGRNSMIAVAFAPDVSGLAPMGASLNLASGTAGYPTADGQAVNWGEAQQLDTYVFGSTGTKWAQQIQKIFANPGDDPSSATPSASYSYWPNLNAFVNTHGGKVLISLRPHWNTYNSNQDTAFTNTVTDLHTKLGSNWKLVLWSEANGPKFGPSGTQPEFSSATDYHNYWQHYAAIARSIDPTIPLVYDPEVASGSGNGGSGNQSGAVSYCPPAVTSGGVYLGPDEIYCDYYCTSYIAGQRIDSLSALATSMGLPFGLGEWGLAASSVGPTQAQWNTYVKYLRDTIFGARQASGALNGWLLFWAYNGAAGGTGGGDMNGDGIKDATDTKIGDLSSSGNPGILYFRNGLGS